MEDRKEDEKKPAEKPEEPQKGDAGGTSRPDYRLKPIADGKTALSSDLELLVPGKEFHLMPPQSAPDANSTCTCNSVCTCVPVSSCACDAVCKCDVVTAKAPPKPACSCVGHTACSCVSHRSCACVGHTSCSCVSHSSGGCQIVSHYWRPN